MQDSKDNINQAYADWGEGMSSRIDEDIQILKKFYRESSAITFTQIDKLIDDFREIQKLIKENFI